ncbi:hypothetical protein [Acetobacter fallax]|uniref:Sulfotransferase domain-containing protein n=1 Tax=Acetobacter fallax TaxID=1737473 RepID=A0ABX0KDD9_9PROT|nr:hypothetical protein [Acetobacter fallax]NHO34464.1 hypothetical protein [Acetobacter fallax]NHO38024.1 hypothetical protein [Acetobacter fallax]
MIDNTKLIFLCVGLPRSGSTWAFNVIINMINYINSDHVTESIYSDEINDIFNDLTTKSTNLVVKSHMPGESLCFISKCNFVISIITLRSPYDCIFSLMERFNFTFQEALLAIHRSCVTILKFMKSGEFSIFRYEDGFIGNEQTLKQLENLLGISIDYNKKIDLIEKLSSNNIRQHLKKLEKLGIFLGDDPVHEIEPKTQWHFNHLGDGQVGNAAYKLTKEQISIIGYTLRDILPIFGYSIIDMSPSFSRGTYVEFGENGRGGSCLGSGFGLIESWGVWSIKDRAEIKLKLEKTIVGNAEIVLHCRIAPTLMITDRSAQCFLSVNGITRMSIVSSPDNSEYINFSLPIYVQIEQDVEEWIIQISSIGMMSPFSLGLGEDTRPIGLGLISITVR